MAKAFHEVEFPRDISYGSTFGPSFSTDVVTMPNGAEQRNVNWEYPRCSGNLSAGIKKEEQFNELLKFFYNRKGKAYGFRFYDWLDHTAEFVLLGIGDSETSSYQLIKNYLDIDLDMLSTRKISKPIKDSVHIYLYDCTPPDPNTPVRYEEWQRKILTEFSTEIPSGAEMEEGWVVDYTTGKLTLAEPLPANIGIVATFDFDVPVRFDTDAMAANYEYFKAYGWTDIPVIELKF